MTGVELPRWGDRWVWVAHHPIPQAKLRDRGYGELAGDPCFAVLVARRAHERHHSRTEPIPLERLPERAVSAIDGLGPWAEDLLRRYHPSNILPRA